MPLPIAHSLAGLALVVLRIDFALSDFGQKKRYAFLLVLVFVCNGHDLDFLPGIFVGEPNKYHHGVSHSVTFAVAFGLTVYAFVQRWFRELSKAKLAGILVAASVSHVFLDYFSADTSYPYGVPLLWPFVDTYYIASHPIFIDVRRGGESALSFIGSLFSFHNVRAALVELFLFVTIICAIVVARQSFFNIKTRKLILIMTASSILFYVFRFAV